MTSAPYSPSLYSTPALTSASLQSLHPMLCAVRDALHPALVSPSAFARVAAAMERLPDALTTLFYLETRLHDDSAVDLVLRVGEESRQTLLNLRMPSVLPADSRAWARVRALTRDWNDERSGLSTALHHLWLEFDCDDMPTGSTLVPGVFACFGELRTPGYSAERWLQYSELAFDSLLDGALDPAVARHVDRCFRALPDAAYVPYVGVMLGRPADSVRICLTGFDAQDLSEYLHRIEWRASIHDVEDVVAELSDAQPAGPLQGAGMIHLDVSAQGVWRLGLEFACQRAPQLRGTLVEHALFERLVSLGLSTPDKAEALRAWPGSRAVRVPAANGDRVVLRRVNHVKLVLRPDRAPEAKAYLAARHFPRAQLHAHRALVLSRHPHRSV